LEYLLQLDPAHGLQQSDHTDLNEINWQICGEGFEPLPLGDVEEDFGRPFGEEQLPSDFLLDSSPSEILNQSQSVEEDDAAYHSQLFATGCTASESLSEAQDAQADQRSRHKSRRSSHLSQAGQNTPSNYQRPPCSLTQGALSTFSIEQKVSTSFHRQMTSSNLLKIYHDVLEHHLSCWVAEITCPYRQSSEPTSIAMVAPEWGTSWTNRILQRTVRLDYVAQSCKLLYLTASEQKAASNALHLAVLAFATQWAQGSLRSRRRYSNMSQDDASEASSPSIMEDFDRTLQQYFWGQTHRALQEVTEIDCYQVACAEIIFSLAQRPWHNGKRSRSGHEMPPTQSIRAQVQLIIEKDGPPIYSERAARRMHILKYRCDSFKNGLGSKNRSMSHGIESMAREDRDTIGLLYWLAIMFDTVAASMYERPVVVVDEECRYEVQRDLGSFGGPTGPYRWDYEIFMQRGTEVAHRTYWPCSYDRAAEDVTKSAPVKVLLFRHVSYLQNALRQSAPDHQLEDIIFNTMLIYDYWNRTHGAFFKELVQNFPNVPHRIRGWFVCISAHWHLAVLLLADHIEFIDEHDLGLSGAKSERLATGMVARLRHDSSRELSDLGHVATLPTYPTTSPESPDLHHAVNAGTILTEPWTMILIRAFSKSCIYFLEKAEDMRDARGTSGFICDFKQTLQEAENCIKVLWLLGKKSDMAWDLAETLQHAMRSLRSGFVWHMM
jgi:hypothetical protein